MGGPRDGTLSTYSPRRFSRLHCGLYKIRGADLVAYEHYRRTPPEIFGAKTQIIGAQ
jgi:hypothetical protein